MHGKVFCIEKSCINHNGEYDCKFIHIHSLSFILPKVGYINMVNDEGCDSYNKKPECDLCGDWGLYIGESEKIYSCSCKNKKELLTLTYIGCDNCNRTVYDDSNGKLYVDINPHKIRTELYTKTNNEFNGEPDSLVSREIEITFIPKRKRLIK